MESTLPILLKCQINYASVQYAHRYKRIYYIILLLHTYAYYILLLL